MSGQEENQVSHIIASHVSNGLWLLGASDLLLNPPSKDIHRAGQTLDGHSIIAIRDISTLGDETDALSWVGLGEVVDDHGEETLSGGSSHGSSSRCSK